MGDPKVPAVADRALHCLRTYDGFLPTNRLAGLKEGLEALEGAGLIQKHSDVSGGRRYTLSPPTPVPMTIQ